MQSGEIVVSISCITYNHAPYIRQCLDGFMMQQTNFAFEVLIHDDASTDGTTEIIKEYEAKYPDIIKPIYEEENQWVKGRRGSAVFNFPRAKGKYIAMCEGDDYWTDPLKLQKQVDFLSRNTEMSMACHRTQVVACNNSHQEYIHPEEIDESRCFDLKELIEYKWIPRTLSILFCREVLDRINYQYYTNFFDIVLFYEILACGKGFIFSDVMGVYRVHVNGTWSAASSATQTAITLSTLKEIYEKHQTDLSLSFISNYLEQRGYCGVSFLNKYYNLFVSILIIIFKRQGFSSMVRTLIHACNFAKVLKSYIIKQNKHE